MSVDLRAKAMNFEPVHRNSTQHVDLEKSGVHWSTNVTDTLTVPLT